MKLHLIRMASPRAPKTFILGTVFLLSAFTLSAQERPREISGVVTDGGHEPLKGAVVQIENDETKSVISFLTRRDGSYFFHHLRDGEYLISATYRGHRSSTQRISRFDRPASRTINFKISLY